MTHKCENCGGRPQWNKLSMSASISARKRTERTSEKCRLSHVFHRWLERFLFRSMHIESKVDKVHSIRINQQRATCCANWCRCSTFSLAGRLASNTLDDVVVALYIAHVCAYIPLSMHTLDTCRKSNSFFFSVVVVFCALHDSSSSLIYLPPFHSTRISYN